VFIVRMPRVVPSSQFHSHRLYGEADSPPKAIAASVACAAAGA